MKNLLGFLFPSWNFFNDTYASPILFLKTAESLIEVFPIVRPRPYNLFFNPQLNQYFFYHSVVNRFINLLQDTNNSNEKILESIELKILKEFCSDLINQDQYPGPFLLQLAYTDRHKMVEEVIFQIEVDREL